jgi:IS30 family transposase
VFDPLKSTRQAARELGLNPDTCAGWVRKAGLKSHGKKGAGPHPGRNEYFRMRKTGVSGRKAAAAVGIHLRTAQEWDQGTVRPAPDAFTLMAGWWTSNGVPYRSAVPPCAGAGADTGIAGSRHLNQGDRTRTWTITVNDQPRAEPKYRCPDTLPAARGAPESRSPRARSKTAKLARESDLHDYVKDKLLIRWSSGTNQPHPSRRVPRQPGDACEPYFPKGTGLCVHGPEDPEHVAQELNGRPRKTLGWKTPAERLRDLLLTT